MQNYVLATTDPDYVQFTKKIVGIERNNELCSTTLFLGRNPGSKDSDALAGRCEFACNGVCCCKEWPCVSAAVCLLHRILIFLSKKASEESPSDGDPRLK